MGDNVTCKEKILSEEYYDLITDYLFTEEFKESGVPDYCYTKIDDKITSDRAEIIFNFIYPKF